MRPRACAPLRRTTSCRHRALDEGRHVIEIITGIFESAAYGTRVDLPQANREHPLMRWRNEAGLGEPDPMPMADADWLAEEEKRLGT
ncbi:MAG: hypothetical protein ACI906_001448 [Candidatus Latescibacterota bacterium]|jgi:hypothetical protein